MTPGVIALLVLYGSFIAAAFAFMGYIAIRGIIRFAKKERYRMRRKHLRIVK